MKLFALACVFAINWFLIFSAACVCVILFVPFPIPGAVWSILFFSGLLAAIHGLASALVNRVN